MEILVILGFFAAIILPLHLLNKRDAAQRELAAALKADPRLRIELMCARDYQEAQAAMRQQAQPAAEQVAEENGELQAA
ncbi:MAG: hypothetical protein GX093_13975 [Xanthomonadaceae bacterium]|nr:hypothetical protein [Xanthomonadaceae bacterium]